MTTALTLTSIAWAALCLYLWATGKHCAFWGVLTGFLLGLVIGKVFPDIPFVSVVLISMSYGCLYVAGWLIFRGRYQYE